MEGPDPQREHARPSRAVDAADLMVALASQRSSVSVVLEPGRDSHTITLLGANSKEVSDVTPQLADAVVARLALLAGLELTQPGEQLGRLSVRVNDEDAELLVAVRVSSGHLGAELRRLVGMSDTTPSPPPTSRVKVDDSRTWPYRVKAELGRGGMGVVYRAEHEALRKDVAIKLLHNELAQHGEHCFRFVREARAASRIRHEGIVEVMDFGALPDGRAYLVMELIEGKTLREILVKQGALEPKRAVRIAQRAAAALGAAHRKNVVHRDFKPENLFVVAHDKIKIADFGAAKLLDGQAPGDTQDGRLLGTPWYMAPEYSQGQKTDGRADVYSLGCVLFEMLTGKPPYGGTNMVEIAMHHVRTPIPEVRAPNGEVPPAVAAIVRRAMAKRPVERYQKADEMASDLEQAAAVLERKGWRRWLPI